MRRRRRGFIAGYSSGPRRTCRRQWPASPFSPNEQLLTKIVAGLKDHPALLAYKGVDEPRNAFRGDNWIRSDGLTRAHEKLNALDGHHPVVIVQAPAARSRS